jgi:hypothetical protein
VIWVRVAFIVLTFLHFVGPVVYLALWVIVPYTPGGTSAFERGVATVQGWLGSGGSGTPPPRRPANGADAARFDIVSGGPLA